MTHNTPRFEKSSAAASGPPSGRDSGQAFREPVRIGWINPRGMGAVIYRDLRRYLLFGVAVISSPLLTIMILTIVSLVIPDDSPLRAHSLVYVASGFVALNLMMGTFQGVAFSFLFDKMEGMWTDVFSAPLRGWEIALALYVSAHIQAIPVLVTTILAGSLFGLPLIPAHPWTFVLGLLPAIWFMASLGLIGGLLSKRWDTISAQLSFVVMPFLFLSGTFYGRDALPPWLAAIQDFNPVWHIVVVIRYGIIGVIEGSWQYSFSFAAIVSLVLCSLCMYLFNLGYRLIV